jgi:hypothetical protein
LSHLDVKGETITQFLLKLLNNEFKVQDAMDSLKTTVLEGFPSITTPHLASIS